MKDSDIGVLIKNPVPFGESPHSKYDKLISFAKQVPPANTAVVHPCDETSLRGACEAAELGIILPILVGPVAKVTAVAKQHGIASECSRCSSLTEAGSHDTVARGVQKSRPTDGSTPVARRTRFLGVDRCEQLLHGAR
jgi:phosphotransacetylase